MSKSAPDPGERRAELASGYVLDALSLEERQEVEERLERGDPELAAEIAAFQQVVGAVPHALAPVQPPAQVKARLMWTLATQDKPLEVEATPLSRRLDAEQLERIRLHFNRAAPTRTQKGPEKKAALLIVDMLEDYVLPGAPMELPRARTIIPSLSRRLAQARQEAMPIVFVNDQHDDDDPDLHRWPRHGIAGSLGSRVIAELAPQPGEQQVAHATYSGFFGTDLEARLDALGVEKVILTGNGLDVCILMTAIDALMRGFEVEIPDDCVAGLGEDSLHFVKSRLALLPPYQGGRRRG